MTLILWDGSDPRRALVYDLPAAVVQVEAEYDDYEASRLCTTPMVSRLRRTTFTLNVSGTYTYLQARATRQALARFFLPRIIRPKERD